MSKMTITHKMGQNFRCTRFIWLGHKNSFEGLEAIVFILDEVSSNDAFDALQWEKKKFEITHYSNYSDSKNWKQKCSFIKL